MNNESFTVALGLQSEIERLSHFGEVDACVAFPEKPDVWHNVDSDLKDWWVAQARLIVHPPIDVTQFFRFLRLTREWLHLRIMQSAGSNEAGCSLTICFDKPVLLTALLANLGQICKVEAISNGALAEERCPDTIEELIAVEGPENESNMAIFVSLSEN